MPVVRVTIVDWVDDAPQPGLVAFEIVDASGTTHRFVDKQSVPSDQELSAGTAYPIEGSVACQIEAAWADERGRSLLRINTDPWGVESVQGARTFVVLADLVRR